MLQLVAIYRTVRFLDFEDYISRVVVYISSSSFVKICVIYLLQKNRKTVPSNQYSKSINFFQRQGINLHFISI